MQGFLTLEGIQYETLTRFSRWFLAIPLKCSLENDAGSFSEVRLLCRLQVTFLCELQASENCERNLPVTNIATFYSGSLLGLSLSSLPMLRTLQPGFQVLECCFSWNVTVLGL